mgnify:CR=1 FL=1
MGNYYVPNIHYIIYIQFMSYKKICTAIQGYTELYRAIHSYKRLCRPIQTYTGLYKAIQGYTQLYRAMQDDTQLHKAIHSYTLFPKKTVALSSFPPNCLLFYVEMETLVQKGQQVTLAQMRSRQT